MVKFFIKLFSVQLERVAQAYAVNFRQKTPICRKIANFSIEVEIINILERKDI